MSYKYRPYIKRSDYYKIKERTHCAYCRMYISGTVNIDHVYPLNKGGTSNISNLVASCLRCNSMKGDFLINEFRDRMKYKRDVIYNKALTSFYRLRKCKKDYGSVSARHEISRLLHFRGEHTYLSSIIHSLDNYIFYV
jgi:5-methylcytosine-specific restriction endonuclease McrA